MDNNSAALLDHESDLIDRSSVATATNHKQNNAESGWQTVSYPKRNRKAAPLKPQSQKYSDSVPNGGGAADVFRSIEAHAEERRRKLLESRVAALDVAARVVTRRSSEDSEDEDSDVEVSGADGSAGEAKKVRQKKPKKPKVTVAEAAARMDAGDLGAFLADITVGR